MYVVKASLRLLLRHRTQGSPLPDWHFAGSIDVNVTLFCLRSQTMDPADEDKFDFDPLDVTKTWPEDIFPLQPVGRLVLNKNVDNFFAENEQLAFAPGLVVPGASLYPQYHMRPPYCMRYRGHSSMYMSIIFPHQVTRPIGVVCGHFLMITFMHVQARAFRFDCMTVHLTSKLARATRVAEAQFLFGLRVCRHLLLGRQAAADPHLLVPGHAAPPAGPQLPAAARQRAQVCVPQQSPRGLHELHAPR